MKQLGPCESLSSPKRTPWADVDVRDVLFDPPPCHLPV
eukprot:CAMPEP_0177354644 /NCGR_PEP_ID=MMETSP0368-20130122/33532_1 /TAXON_ID=447022 ORGANISM="Scrippsiella hangoei-like, Strain SHHI-4" /NCGR_SAMPLE_ID=MMETSP0368 /ASSEMBLY_ACC=CAM_ASM_000363 /LENGTH=37 /DNA_ID= /DNA_START= /DNA_END= /DNA_ORIENTATION=